MNRATFNAMVAQYAVKDVSGEGAVSWEKGAHCVIPEVLIGGKVIQDGTPTTDAPIMPVFSEGTEVVARGQNLLNFSGRTKINMPWSTNTSVRNFDGKGIYVGMTVNNFSNIDHVADVNVDLDLQTVSFTAKSSGYGIAFDIALIPGGTYAASAEIVGDGLIMIAFYDKSGNYLSNTSILPASGGFTTPDDAYWAIVELRTYSADQSAAFSNIKIELGTTATGYEPYFDGGRAVAPVPLLAAVDGSCQSTWDPQTGKGLNWWHDVIELDGSEDEVWGAYTNDSNRWCGFTCLGNALPEKMARNAYWCNQFQSLSKGGILYDGNPHVWCGVDSLSIYVAAYTAKMMPFYDASLEDFGLANWKAHLRANPIKLWVARNEPVEFQTDPQPLVQPKGSGTIIQTGGSIHGCPITAKYVTHS